MDVASFVRGLRLSRDAVVGTYTLLLFEFLILLDREYEAIYKSRWSLGKVLYLVCRFCPLLLYPIAMYGYLVDHTLAFCNSIVMTISIIFIVLPAAPQFVYVLRAWAFTGANKKLLFIFIPSLFGYLFVVIWYALSGVVVLDAGFRLLGRSGCFRGFPRGEGNTFSRNVYAAIALDVVVGMVVLIHCIRMKVSQTRLGQLLHKQGLLYFPVMLTLNLIAVLVSSTGTFRGYDAMVFTVATTVSNVMACRFILQIREYSIMEPTSEHLMDMLNRDIDLSLSSPTIDPVRSQERRSATYAIALQPMPVR